MNRLVLLLLALCNLFAVNDVAATNTTAATSVLITRAANGTTTVQTTAAASETITKEQTTTIATTNVQSTMPLTTATTQPRTGTTYQGTTGSTSIEPMTTESITTPAIQHEYLLLWTVKITISSPFRLLRSAIFSAHADAVQAVGNTGAVGVTTLLTGDWFSEFWTLSANYHRKLIYYTDYYRNFIGVYNMQEKSHRKLFQGLAFGIDGLSVDWITNNVYWTDTDTKWIMMGNEDISIYSHVVPIASKVPSIVAVDPLTRTIYWSEVDTTESRLLKCGMDGKNVVTLQTFTNVVSIDSLIFDVIGKRLFWGERIPSTVVGQSYTGRVRSMSTTNSSDIKIEHTAINSRFMGISVYKDFLYIANSPQSLVYVMNRTKTSLHTTYFHQRGVNPRTVAIYAPDIQPKPSNTNPCSTMHCAHLCIPLTDTTSKCSCAIGYQLMADLISCAVELIPDNFLLLLDATHAKIYQVQLNTPTNYASIPISPSARPHSVDYDETTKKLYWSDTNNLRIIRSDLNGDNQETFMQGVKAFSISIDPISRNLYFADSTSDAIVVMSLDLPNITKTLQVQDMHYVYELHVDARLGKIFWTDWGQLSVATGKTIGLIESVDLDGSNREVLVNTSNKPHGVTTDPEGKMVYWTEVDTGILGWYNLTTKQSGTFSLRQAQTESNLLLGIAFYAGYVYVTDTNKNSLYKVATSDLVAGTQTATTITTFGPAIFYDLSAVRFFSKSNLPTGTTGCSSNRGGCNQICLPTTTGHQCQCAYHHDYIASNNTCVARLTKDDERPTFGSTCPGHQTYPLGKCSNTALVKFTAPTATDNSGSVIIKSNVQGSPPYSLTLGDHYFQYRAQDLSGNLAYCLFIVRVNSISCGSPAGSLIPDTADQSTPSCEFKYGSVINVTCPNEQQPRFQYECGADTDWLVNGVGSCDVSTTTSQTATAPLPRKRPQGISKGVIALIVILVILVIAAASFFLFRKYRHKFSGVRFWNRGEDTMQLTETNYCSPEHDFGSSNNIYVTM